MKKVSCILLSILIVLASTFVALSANRGDVNSDGKIDSIDALCILQYSVGYIFSDFNTDIADMNMDGKVNSTDALFVLKITVGLIKPSTVMTRTTEVINSTTSTYIDSNATTSIYIPSTTRTTMTQPRPSITIPPLMTTIPETESTTKLNVYNALAIQRRFGFNKAYDNLAGFTNFYLDTIRVYFTYEGRDWLIEFWKGEYAMASVGCEIAYYYNDKPSQDKNGALDWTVGEKKHFKAVEDDDAMYTSMELWQYVKASDQEPVKRITFDRRLCWWATQLEDGILENHRDRTSLVMRGAIEFPSTEMRDLFVEGLEERGFHEGSTASYQTTERYSVDGKEVTVMWRYFDEDRFQDNSSN